MSLSCIVSAITSIISRNVNSLRHQGTFAVKGNARYQSAVGAEEVQYRKGVTPSQLEPGGATPPQKICIFFTKLRVLVHAF